MTPEQIEEYKAYVLPSRGLPPSASIKVLAALEEAQQDLECFRAKTEPESLGYGAKWKQNALVAREERDALRDELTEAQQTIALKQSNIEMLVSQVTDETALHAKTAAKLIIAEQTIARQQLAMSRSLTNLTDALNFPFAYTNDDTRCVKRMIDTAITLLSEAGGVAKEDWESKIKPGDKVLVNVGHIRGQELPVSANHSHKRLVSVIAADGLWNVGYGDFDKVEKGETQP